MWRGSKVARPGRKNKGLILSGFYANFRPRGILNANKSRRNALLQADKVSIAESTSENKFLFPRKFCTLVAYILFSGAFIFRI